VAERLEGQVNVAAVDVPANRDLGTRFEIKGFPTILLLSKGKVYTFKGRRSLDDIVEFATSGYQIQSPEEVPPQLGFFGEIFHLFRQSYKQARKDILNGQYFTPNVIYVVLPVIFILLLLILIFLPIPEPSSADIRKRLEQEAKKVE
jgi:hypothetical protein